MKIERAQEGNIRARFVACPVCKVRIAVVEGFEPPGANLEELFREALDRHLKDHARKHA